MGGGFHGEGVGGHVGQFLLHQLEFAERLPELFAGVGVPGGSAKAKLGGPGATGAESGPAEVQHRQRQLQPLAQLPDEVFSRHADVVERQPGCRRSTDAALGHAPLYHFEAGHIRRDNEGGNVGAVAAWDWRPGHNVNHAGNAAIGDISLFAVENVGIPFGSRDGGGLDIGGIGAGLRLGEGESGQHFAPGKPRQPVPFLFLCAGEQQRPQADAMVGVHEHGHAGVVPAEHLDDAAVAGLREAAAPVFLGDCHAQHAQISQTPDNMVWNRRFTVDAERVDLFLAEALDGGNGLGGGLLLVH